MIRLFVGLGNPGPQYEDTRHNAGFWWIDALARQLGVTLNLDRGYHGLVARTQIEGENVWLLEPQTFMNLSGAVLKPWLRRPFWAAAADLMVVSDEVQLPVGAFRFRAKGSAGGHNGLKSIEQALGSQEYARLRIGVGPNDPQRGIGDLADYVLGDFGKQEAADVRALLPTFDEALRRWAADGVLAVMNAYNR